MPEETKYIATVRFDVEVPMDDPSFDYLIWKARTSWQGAQNISIAVYEKEED